MKVLSEVCQVVTIHFLLSFRDRSAASRLDTILATWMYNCFQGRQLLSKPVHIERGAASLCIQQVDCLLVVQRLIAPGCRLRRLPL